MYALLKQNLKFKVCFLSNCLVVKIKQLVKLNVQIKNECSIRLLVIILLREKIEHVFKFIVLCAIQFQLMVFTRCQQSKVFHRIFFFKKNVSWAKKVENDWFI